VVRLCLNRIRSAKNGLALASLSNAEIRVFRLLGSYFLAQAALVYSVRNWSVSRVSIPFPICSASD
jgi:hypothetical protein